MGECAVESLFARGGEGIRDVILAEAALANVAESYAAALADLRLGAGARYEVRWDVRES
jgi:hypothetical protein